MAEIALRASPTVRWGVWIWVALAATALGLGVVAVLCRAPIPGELDAIVVWQSLLPRAAIAPLAGAALGLAGALLQRVLRNPIADPSTLGIASGAQLALSLAALVWPLGLPIAREGIAFAGGGVAVAIVLAWNWRRGLDPVTVVLSGMVVSLMAAAAANAVILARGEYALGIFIWGAGSLHQQSWQPAALVAVSLVLGGGVSALLARPLAVLSLEDSSARSLGVALPVIRGLVIALAVWLAGCVVAEVGLIAFVGLAAPIFARIAGARTLRQTLLAAPLIGAVLLWLTDGLVQMVAVLMPGIDLPTGAVTGLLGGPLLLWMLPRLRTAAGLAAPRGYGRHRLRHPAFVVCGAVAILVVGSLLVGRNAEGLSLAWGADLGALLPLRTPRILSAAAAGALLGAAGALLQRITGNPLAGPEVLGVSAGAGVGLAAVLLTTAVPGPGAMIAGCVGGSAAATLCVLALAARRRLAPEPMLLGGLALGSAALAVLSIVLASGDPRAFPLFVWMSGSVDRLGTVESVAGFALALLLLAPVPLVARWLDLLPLGESVGRSLGLGVARARLILAMLAALMIAVGAFLVGPLSLIGLVGPHLARLVGFGRGLGQTLAAAGLGASLMVLADWIGRTIAYPYQIPIGLCAALIGGPYLIWLLGGGRRRAL